MFPIKQKAVFAQNVVPDYKNNENFELKNNELTDSLTSNIVVNHSLENGDGKGGSSGFPIYGHFVSLRFHC
jgi:hypothetical protein